MPNFTYQQLEEFNKVKGFEKLYNSKGEGAIDASARLLDGETFEVTNQRPGCGTHQMNGTQCFYFVSSDHLITYLPKEKETKKGTE